MSQPPAEAVGVTAELLARHDRPGPRYTSYPTAVEFTSAFGPLDHAASLDRAGALVDEPLSLYVHLPFCRERCSFCGCHVVTTKRATVADAYLGRLIAEAGLVADHLGDRVVLEQYHWGGGTPTFYSPSDLARLHQELLTRFEVAPDAEVAVEVDPRVTTPEHLRTLRELDFNRLSMGVQDLDPMVQELIGRGQTRSETVALFEAARSLGFASINIDLVFGLPGQTPATLHRTLEQVLALRPDRIAVYSFAYLPTLRGNQRRIDRARLPDRLIKFELLSSAITTITGDGYLQIGMDHFALPDDELSRARGDGTLSRNFMGYTTKRAPDVVAIGSSGISDVQGSYAQNHKRLASYYESVDRRELPVERGLTLTHDDRVRRHVITELMCNHRVGTADVESRFSIDFDDHFVAELDAVQRPGGAVAEGLLTVTDEELCATPLGELFIRNVAMAFDAYRTQGDGAASPAVFSRTV